MQGFDSNLFIVNAGDAGDVWSTTNKVNLILQHSDTDVDGDYAACAATDVRAAIAATSGIFGVLTDAADHDQQSYKAQYIGNKRYARVYVDFVETHSTGSPFAVIGVQSKAAQAPVA
jgi:hypothetical protein